jgi:predicted PurR-regulated permease PerM
MWVTLIGIVVGEATMGVPGVLIAPALLHYVREELRAIPAR